MKITVLVRTRNEAYHIENFIRQYNFADKILIEDYSEDGTAELAEHLGRKYNIDVNVWKAMPSELLDVNGVLVTHEPRQINRLIYRAIDEGTDWIIYDDCDSYPNHYLKKHAREILADPSLDKVYAYHLYVYREYGYFPDMNKPGQGMWAWRPSRVDRVCKEDDPFDQPWLESEGDFKEQKLNYPLVLLHNFAANQEYIDRKIKHYNARGLPYKDPIEQCGHLELLPVWAKI